MKLRLAMAMLAILPLGMSAQSTDSVSTANPRYLEDQFYIGITYNLLLKRPDGINPGTFPYGLQLGFIKDLPLNPERTFALGIGLGYGVNSYYSNLRALEGPNGTEYRVADADTYKRNKLETHLIEVPLEIRWRNSTPEDFSFWRIYGGVKFGYIVGSRSKFVTGDFTDSFYNRDTENFRYGLMLNVGYNTINLHAYYGLNSLFSKGTTGPDGNALDMAPLHIGLIFYIL